MTENIENIQKMLDKTVFCNRCIILSANYFAWRNNYNPAKLNMHNSLLITKVDSFSELHLLLFQERTTDMPLARVLMVLFKGF